MKFTSAMYVVVVSTWMVSHLSVSVCGTAIMINTIVNNTQTGGADEYIVAISNGVVFAVGFNRIFVYDGTTVTAISPPPSVYGFDGVAVNSATGVVYIFASGSRADDVFTLNGGTLTEWQSVSSQQCGIVRDGGINSATGVLYAVCSNAVISLNGAGILSTVFSNSPFGNALSVDSFTGIVYIAATSASGALPSYPSLISVNGTTVTTLLTNSQCRATDVFAYSGVVYAACEMYNQWDNGTFPFSQLVWSTSQASVVTISVAGTMTTLATQAQCPGASDVSYDCANGVLFVSCYGCELVPFVGVDCINPPAVVAINGGVVTTLANSSQCLNPRSIAVNTATGVVYVACANSVISIAAPLVSPPLSPGDRCGIPFVPPAQTAASVTIRLTLDISVVTASAAATSTFKTTFATTVSAALGITSDRIQVTSITAGSILVTFLILPPQTRVESTFAASIPGGPPTPSDLAVNIVNQATTTGSELTLRVAGSSAVLGTVDTAYVPSTTLIQPCPGGGYQQPCPSTSTSSSGSIITIGVGVGIAVAVVIGVVVGVWWYRKKQKTTQDPQTSNMIVRVNTRFN